jgi:hypothetical protein
MTSAVMLLRIFFSWCRIVCVCAGILFGPVTGRAYEEAGENPSGLHSQLNGVVSRIQGGLLFVKTPMGQVTLSSTTALKDAKVGDEMRMWVNEDNYVIDLHRKGESTRAHRYCTRPLGYASPLKDEIKFWTPEGEKTFPVGEWKTKLSVIKEGSPITVELNETNQVIDIHRVEMTMQVASGPFEKSYTHLKLSGVVSKVQAGLVTVKTPTGHYTVGLKAIGAVCKVGDRVTMFVNEGNTVIDIHKGDNPSPLRFIVGTLTYVADDHKEILMWTPDGEKRFAVTASESKLSTIKEGTPIVVELNDTGNIVDVHRTE